MIDIVGFLEGKTPDHRGRMLTMLWNQTDDDAENTHDYIQWMFPLDQPSRSVTGAPVLNELDIEDIRIANWRGRTWLNQQVGLLGFLKGTIIDN